MALALSFPLWKYCWITTANYRQLDSPTGFANWIRPCSRLQDHPGPLWDPCPVLATLSPAICRPSGLRALIGPQRHPNPSNDSSFSEQEIAEAQSFFLGALRPGPARSPPLKRTPASASHEFKHHQFWHRRVVPILSTRIVSTAPLTNLSAPSRTRILRHIGLCQEQLDDCSCSESGYRLLACALSCRSES